LKEVLVGSAFSPATDPAAMKAITDARDIGGFVRQLNM
jgi:hypothetical protein